MKTILIYFEDEEHESLKNMKEKDKILRKIKGKYSWHDFILNSTIKHNLKIKKPVTT